MQCVPAEFYKKAGKQEVEANKGRGKQSCLNKINPLEFYMKMKLCENYILDQVLFGIAFANFIVF